MRLGFEKRCIFFGNAGNVVDQESAAASTHIAQTHFFDIKFVVCGGHETPHKHASANIVIFWSHHTYKCAVVGLTANDEFEFGALGCGFYACVRALLR